MSYDLPIYSNEELSKASSYPPLQCGRYKFRVTDRNPGTTSTGNHMERLVFDVYHRGQNNKPMKCFHTFFIENDTKDKKAKHLYDIKKVKWFLDCIGVEYAKDAFERVVNREGEANFLVDVYQKDGKEREKFVVPDEGFNKDAEVPVTPSPMKLNSPGLPNDGVTNAFDDDIPF